MLTATISSFSQPPLMPPSILLNKELLANHIRTCVARDIREGKDETIDELVATLQKLIEIRR